MFANLHLITPNINFDKKIFVKVTEYLSMQYEHFNQVYYLETFILTRSSLNEIFTGISVGKFLFFLLYFKCIFCIIILIKK